MNPRIESRNRRETEMSFIPPGYAKSEKNEKAYLLDPGKRKDLSLNENWKKTSETELGRTMLGTRRPRAFSKIGCGIISKEFSERPQQQREDGKC